MNHKLSPGEKKELERKNANRDMKQPRTIGEPNTHHATCNIICETCVGGVGARATTPADHRERWKKGASGPIRQRGGKGNRLGMLGNRMRTKRRATSFARHVWGLWEPAPPRRPTTRKC